MKRRINPAATMNPDFALEIVLNDESASPPVVRTFRFAFESRLNPRTTLGAGTKKCNALQIKKIPNAKSGMKEIMQMLSSFLSSIKKGLPSNSSLLSFAATFPLLSFSSFILFL